MKLQGKIAIVSAASTGIGRAIAKAIAENGGEVALVGRNLKGLEESKRQISEVDGNANIFITDLRDEEEIKKLWSDVKKTWKSVDILINAAGVWHNDNTVYCGPHLEDTPAEQINEVLDVGIRAPMLLARLVLPEMIKKKQGKIINISGTFESGASGWLHYFVSKKALEDFTIGLAEEVREHEIQVNCVSPSDTLTEAYKKFFPDYSEKDVISPDEIAKFVIFLLTKDADSVTGSITVIRNKAAH